MKGHQFPVVSNSATTGHKLQGYTALSLLVNSWYYKENWVYVVLSRVREMKNLYLRKPLSYDLTKYEMKQEMLDMIEVFENEILLDNVDYNELIAKESRQY